MHPAVTESGPRRPSGMTRRRTLRMGLSCHGRPSLIAALIHVIGFRGLTTIVFAARDPSAIGLYEGRMVLAIREDGGHGGSSVGPYRCARRSHRLRPDQDRRVTRRTGCQAQPAH